MIKDILRSLSFVTQVTRFYSQFIKTQGSGVPSMSSMSVPSSTSSGVHSINRWSTSSIYFGTEQLTMFQEGNTTHEPTKRNYIDVLSKAFADVPDLVKEI